MKKMMISRIYSYQEINEKNAPFQNISDKNYTNL